MWKPQNTNDMVIFPLLLDLITQEVATAVGVTGNFYVKWGKFVDVCRNSTRKNFVRFIKIRTYGDMK